MYARYFKRFFDILFATLGLIFASPLLLIVTLLLAVANNGKPFFFQIRPGRDAKFFRIVKFKTMNDRRDAAGNLLPDVVRLHPIGRAVRSLSIDELPQMWNVLVGDMSFIGPRPLLVDYLPLYNPEQMRRHQARPGITGWAQVNGRNAISWKQKFTYDIYYVGNISLSLDLKIVAMTIFKIVKRADINAGEHVIMGRFTGNE